MINHFTFNGTSTAQLGLIVSGVSIFGAGSRKVEKAGIPGRNGDLQIELGGFNNYTVRYTVSITNNFTTTAQQIREWLLESKGYCELTDTYHPDEIRKACFNSDIEFTTSMLYKYGQASIQFDCLPERYLTTNTPITTTATADTTTDTTMSLSTVPTPIDISLNGNTTQEGSSGKNKQPNECSTVTYQGVTIEATNGVIRYHGTATASGGRTALKLQHITLPAGTYTAKCFITQNTPNTTPNMNVQSVSNGTYTVIAQGGLGNARTFTLSAQTEIAIGFNYTSGVTYDVYFTVQVETGSTATAYEPHISPTNPQVIHSVSGDNVIAISGKNIIAGEFMADKLVKEVRNSNACYKTEDEHGKCLLFTSSNDIRNGVILDTFKPNTQYTVIGREQNTTTTGSGANIIVTYTDDSYAFIFMGENSPAGTMHDWTFTTASGKSVKTISLYNHHSGNRKLYYEHFGIFEGANATFEPYTRQSYPLYLPVENLFDYSAVTNTGITDDSGTISTVATRLFSAKISVFPNTTYTFKTSAYSQNNERIYINRLIFYGQNGSFLRRNATYNTYSEATFTTPSDTYYLVIDLRTQYLTTSLSKDLLNGNTQLEKGSHANHYTPYGTTPIELNGIGTYSDYIYKNGGKWYVHKETTKKTLDGINETFGGVWGATNNGYAVYKGNMGNRAFSYADKFVYDNVNGYSAMPLYSFGGLSGARVTWTFILPSTVTSLATANTWLQSNNVLLYYPLATPTNTEITDTTLINQLNNIEKAYSYNGTTNILQVSNDNGFMLEVVSLHGSTFNSNYKGEPIITVNATGLIYLNGEVMEVLSAPVTINCQTMQCYNGVVNMNNEVRVNDFPEIKIGANEVGSSMALTITPNNWRH